MWVNVTPTLDREEVVLATADGLPINEYRYKVTYVDYLIRTGKNDTPRNRAMHLDNLIDTYLMGQEGKRRGYEADSSYIVHMQLERKKALGGRFYETGFLDSLARPSDTDVREAFVRQNEKVVIRHLLYPDEQEARQAFSNLQEGAHFIDLANLAYKTESYDSTAGYLGVTTYWQLDDNFAEAAFTLQPGEYSPPVRSRYGWHIILVEDRVFSPIITESEFQTRRSGVENRVWTRKVRLEGDQYVRTFMEGLNVQVNREALLALQQAVKDRLDAAGFNPDQTPHLTNEEIGFVSYPIQPGLILATYELEGQTYEFTAADYIFWLETLPAQEVYHRIGRSLGRALRNEAFALQAEILGLENDPWFRESLRHARAVYLADRVQREAINSYQGEPTEKQIQDAATMMKLLSVKSTAASLWFIEHDSFQDADSAKASIDDQRQEPTDFPSYTEYDNVDYRTLSNLWPFIDKAPLNQTVVLGAGSRWYVLHVQSREVERNTLDDVRDEVVPRLKKQLPIIDLVQSLRSVRDVEVDTVAFEQAIPE